MKSLRRKTKRSQRRTSRRSPKRTSRRCPKRTSRRCPKRTSRRCPKRTSRRLPRRSTRRLMKGGMTREEINQYCATKKGLEKRLCEGLLPKLLENNEIDSGDLEFLIGKWREYITDNFEEITNNIYFEDDEDNEDGEDGMYHLNNFLLRNTDNNVNNVVTFNVISEAYEEGLTGNWDPADFGEVDDETESSPLQEWLNELDEMKRPSMK